MHRLLCLGVLVAAPLIACSTTVATGLALRADAPQPTSAAQQVDGYHSDFDADLGVGDPSGNLLPLMRYAYDTAGPASIACVDPATTDHVQLAYFRPSDAPDRYTEIAPKLQLAAYRLSAYLAASAQGDDWGTRLRVRFACDGAGVPTVAHIPLVSSAATTTFTSLSTEGRAAGLGKVGTAVGRAHVLGYGDVDPLDTDAQGQGNRFDDDTVGAGNLNLASGRYGVEWRSGADEPRWWVLLHELTHTMGAVQPSAAHYGSNGHCLDGTDVMCRGDAPSGSPAEGNCGWLAYDCGNDDYFDPRPAAGSYLATHWNVASDANTYLDRAGPGLANPCDPMPRPRLRGMKLFRTRVQLRVKNTSPVEYCATPTWLVHQKVGRRWRRVNEYMINQFDVPRAKTGPMTLRVAARPGIGTVLSRPLVVSVPARPASVRRS